jgi:hypothetical protein
LVIGGRRVKKRVKNHHAGSHPGQSPDQLRVQLAIPTAVPGSVYRSELLVGFIIHVNQDSLINFDVWAKNKWQVVAEVTKTPAHWKYQKKQSKKDRQNNPNPPADQVIQEFSFPTHG